jgi:hypothetical protein
LTGTIPIVFVQVGDPVGSGIKGGAANVGDRRDVANEIQNTTVADVVTPALFHANPSATLSFYWAKDGKLGVNYQGWHQTKTVLEGQQPFILLGKGR